MYFIASWEQPEIVKLIQNAHPADVVKEYIKPPAYVMKEMFKHIAQFISQSAKLFTTTYLSIFKILG